MKKKILVIIFCLLGSILFAHNINHGNNAFRNWSVVKEKKTIVGSFFMLKEGNVFIADAHNNIINFPLSHLSKEDQAFVQEKDEWVKEINNKLLAGRVAMMNTYNYGGIFFQPAQTLTNPYFIDSAFVPFKPNVYTHWDANYFYVESKGIPNHQMMTGIINWQQQVPIPQCYIGTNAWMIPLNPVLAPTPVPVNPQHFIRGAIAVAVKGVPIFNPYTNTGADAYLTGQLDIYGGHCGRADDYHYHIAPMILYSQTSSALPIAFALDGFAVYGSLEPDGTPMIPLDVNHGHYGSNGVYHYHGSSGAPYMIGRMVGQVTEDSTLQIIPQPHANPVRPAQNPLPGAVITNCQLNGTNNGYNLIYTLTGQNHYINYYWNAGGQYTFKFILPPDTTTSTYNGFTQCTVPVSSSVILNLNMLIEGFYDANTNALVRDTVSVFLRTTTSPYSMVDSAKAYLNSGGAGSFSFSNASNGVNYYIELKHRNSIETWSKTIQTFVNGALSYNFTNSKTKAFGDNLVQIDASPLKYAIYGGDVNQDGIVDSFDLSMIENGVAVSSSGYVITDLTGDNFTDASDLSKADNNAANSVILIRP